MSSLLYTSRRRFLVHAAMLLALRMARWPRLLAMVLQPGRAKVRPLLAGQTARPRRYTPENDGFLIRNGRGVFNRSLYGPTAARAGGAVVDGFRVDAGDLPEFALFLPGRGGVLRLGVRRGEATKWLFELAEVTARFRAGHVAYEMCDEALLGKGVLRVEVQTAGEGAGLQAMVRSQGLASGAQLVWVFGGVSGQRRPCSGTVSCEELPGEVAAGGPMEARPEDCAGNRYKIEGTAALLESPAGKLRLQFPMGATMHVARASAWNNGWEALATAAQETEERPVLAGFLPMEGDAVLPLSIEVLARDGGEAARSAEKAAGDGFAERRRQIEALAGAVRLETPDEFLAPAVGALLTATDALWSAGQGSLMGEAVGERAADPGWRGPYALDAVGRHDRMREHLRFWLARQNQERLPPDLNGDVQMQAAADAGSSLTRKESLLHTNGDIAGSRQDRNLAFFDALVRHLRWTGSAAFAREIWPALLRHMDWQYRLFRRVFANPDAEARPDFRLLPLYESYGCVPASDNLQYNGGGVAHATAYNYFLNRATASIARLIGEDPVPFDEEAALTREAMLQLLWMPGRGGFAEAKESAVPQSVFVNPALWTVSRTLDAELPTPRQAWQMCQERLSAMRRIPVEGAAVPPGNYLLASSDWGLGEPALNRISMAEDVHFALALWQAGLVDEAYGLLKGSLLDSMYQGVCPGNFQVTSPLDPHHEGTQRDAADSVGITARALVEGLFGVLPDLLRGTLTIRPGFPTEWSEARLVHPEIDIAWHRDGMHETFSITSRLPQPVALTLLLPARCTSDPIVLSNGKAYPFAFDPNATGTPRLVLTNFPPATTWEIDVRWRGKAPVATPAKATYRVGEAIALAAPLTIERVDDPQGCLRDGMARTPGEHAIFVHMVEEKCGYWLPIPIEIVAERNGTAIAPMGERYETVEMGGLLTQRVTEMLARSYTEPRSSYCSLALPEHLLGGWVDSDVRFAIDDAGLRGAGGVLKTAYGIPFATAADREKPNCRFVSFWKGDTPAVEQRLSGRAHTIYLLMTGTTMPQANRMEHGTVTVRYADGTTSRLTLTAPETWWPVERDYVTDDFLFRMDSARPLPPRVDLRTGRTRVLEHGEFKGKGGAVAGGAATVLHLPLHHERELASVRVECSLYGVVVALLGVTLGR